MLPALRAGGGGVNGRMRWSEDELARHLGKRVPPNDDADLKDLVKPSKYRNKKVIVDSLEFASIKESRRYIELKNMQLSGQITNLKMQVPIECVVNGELICVWVADFYYEQPSNIPGIPLKIYEDVKSAMTRKIPVFRLKLKLVHALYGIEIHET